MFASAASGATTRVWIFDAFTNLGVYGIAWAYVFAPAASLIAALSFVLSGKWKKSTIKLS